MKIIKEKVGDDTGMQTRVWGPAGWLFLHSIAQNYPWHPTNEQKRNYLIFFKQIGNVLPCRYCRESFQEFIKHTDTLLNIDTMDNRKSLAKWLYLIHNKINKKLDIKDNIPSFEQVWNKYESYRSKCSKTPKVLKKGCIDPQTGFRKKCVYKVINVDQYGKPLSFGKKKITKLVVSTKRFIKLVSIKKSNKRGKKLMAIFKIKNRTKTIHFGAAGMSDYTIHKDVLRRKRYIKRHFKDLKTKNPSRAGFLSMFILWNKKSLKSSIQDYKKRLNIYNKSGKFPIKI